MRKEKQNVVLNEIQNKATGYHNGGWGNSTNYAFLGFGENKYFTSDRTIKLDTNFKPLDKNGNVDTKRILKGYGLEIETECSTIKDSEVLTQMIDRIAAEMLPEHLFKYQHDGSLGGESSIECITQVMTKEFVRNNYVGFKRMWQWFEKMGIDCARSGNCGMHVNMSVGLFGTTTKVQQEAIKKFIYIVNKHYEKMCIMVKRSLSRTHYCSKMTSWTNKEYAKAYNLEATSEGQSSHVICFNFYHFNTGRVELRLVGGQPKYVAFRNTMETIFHIVDRVKNISWDDCDNFIEIMRGCNKYVIQRINDVKRADLIDTDTYNEIVRNSDTEYSLGNF